MKRSSTFYNLFVFTTGAAVMLLEFAASRLMAPWFGTSIFVWGNIIGVILIALAAGYYFGGRLADKYPKPEKLFSIVWYAGIISSAIPVVAYAITGSIGNISLQYSTSLLLSVVGSFVVVLFLFAIPIMMLGMVSPFAIRLATHDVNSAGRVAGSLYAASTMGSIIGTFASSFLVVPLLGSRETILISSVLLILAASMGSAKRLTRLTALIIPIVVYIAFSGTLLKAEAGTLYEDESLYQFIQVQDLGDRLALVYNEGLGTQSYFMKEGVLTGVYFDYISLLPALAELPADAHIGVLGLAGGTSTRQLRYYYPEIELTGVELDPAVVEVATEYFELEEQDINVVTADARIYMRGTEEMFDMLVVDAYSNEIYIPWHMTTQEFFSDVKSHLNPGGAVALNIGTTNDNSALFSAMLATLQDSFQHVYVYPVPNAFNNVVFATDTPVDKEALLTVEGDLAPLAKSMQLGLFEPKPSTAKVLTDNRAPIEIYTETMIAKFITSGS